KGRHALTENYSALGPEVLSEQSGRPIAEENRALVESLLAYDALVVAGQAQSHCVAWTVADLLREIDARDRSLARRGHLLEGCTSPVVVPGVVDFTEQAEAAFARFEAAGMHRVRSTEAMESWPGLFLEGLQSGRSHSRNLSATPAPRTFRATSRGRRFLRQSLQEHARAVRGH